MIVTDPTGVTRTAARAAMALSGLWVAGWLIFLQGLMLVSTLHAIGIHS